ncbi:hypothetical protein ACFXO7_35170, partial [Nocardia tengchongensis]
FGYLLGRRVLPRGAPGPPPTPPPARHFGLSDRGAIAPGLRADLVLLDADPLADIAATRAIRAIWCGGTEHAPAQTLPA